MTRDSIQDLLRRYRSGEVDEDEALELLARMPFAELGDARVDTHRSLRQGLGEVVLGQGKTPEQIAAIVRELDRAGEDVLVTRMEPDAARAVLARVPELEHRPEARLLALRRRPGEHSSAVDRGPILVVSAGTSDKPVAEEAAQTAEFFRNKVERLYDVGVAGLHRLLASLDLLRRAHVVIVVAGMEGALPSVVGGLIDRPVIAVPTSVGYGASFGGVAALLGMLNSCSSNVTTVNIDNGFGAAYVATLISRG